MMEREAAAASLDAQGGDIRLPRGRMCWILSGDAVVSRRVAQLLEERKCKVLRSEALPPISAGPLEREQPVLILLDTAGDVNNGASILQEIRRRRIKAPVIVLTQEFSHEFGKKIISQGVRYYFLRDFCEEEFAEVVASLLKVGNLE